MAISFSNTFGNAEDYCKLILTAKDRPLIDLEIILVGGRISALHLQDSRHQRHAQGHDMAHIDWKYFKSEEAPAQKLIRETLTAGEEKLPAYCSETLKWYEESWDGDPQAPFIAAVEEYYTEIYRLFTENRPHDIRIEQVRQQLAVIEEAHRQNPQIH